MNTASYANIPPRMTSGLGRRAGTAYDDWLRDKRLEIERAQEYAGLEWLAGLLEKGKLPEVLLLDDRWHYLDRDKKEGYRACWRADDTLSLVYNTFRHGGENQSFNAYRVIAEEWRKHKEYGQLSRPVFRAGLRHAAKQEAKRKVALDKEETDEQRKAERLAGLMWDFHCLPTSGRNDYLLRKGVQEFADAANVRYGQDFVLLPLQDTDGILHGFQKIHDHTLADGSDKRTYGRLSGHFVTIGQIPPGSVRLNLCEGFATGLSIHAAICEPVICALSTTNLDAVCEALKRRYPGVAIQLWADNDSWKKQNAGVEKATHIAAIFSAVVRIPDFTGLQGDNKPTDFNDLHRLAGLERVSQAREFIYDPVTHKLAAIPANLVKPAPLKWYSREQAAVLMRQTACAWMEAAQSAVVKLPAGQGKTSAILDSIADAYAALLLTGRPGEKLNVEGYLPTLALAEELADKLQEQNPAMQVMVQRGREAQRPDGSGQMCPRAKLVHQATLLGTHTIFETFCHKKDKNQKSEEHCPAWQACTGNGYLHQFGEWGREGLKPTHYDVILKQHALLNLPRSTFENLQLPKVRRIFIDERFYPNLLNNSSRMLAFNEFAELIAKHCGAHAEPIVSAFSEAMRDAALKKPANLLAKLRQHNVDEERLGACIEALKIKEELKITPGMSDEAQQRELDRFRATVGQRPFARKILRLLLEEFGLPRDEAHGVSLQADGEIRVHEAKLLERLNDLDKVTQRALDIVNYLQTRPGQTARAESFLKGKSEHETEVFFKARKLLEQMEIIQTSLDEMAALRLAQHYRLALREFKHTLPGIPTMIVDADADMRILSKVLPKPESFEFTELAVRRNAHVIQCVSSNVSKQAINAGDEESRYLRIANQWLSEQAQTGPAIACGPQELTGNSRQDIQPKLAVLPNVDYLHFGGLRGLDGYKDHLGCLVIGRNQPPVWALEHEARALHRLDPEPLQFCLDSRLPQVPVAYRTKDGSLRWHDTPRHPDMRVQPILEQYRECETQQAIDRLRLIWNKQTKPVLILSAIPLPGVEVDSLVTANQLEGCDRTEQLLRIFLLDSPGVLPLNPALLHRLAPEWFRSEKAARQWSSRCAASIPHDLIRILIGERGIETSLNSFYQLEYRLPNQRGGKPLKALCRGLFQDNLDTLSRWHGQEVHWLACTPLFQESVSLQATASARRAPRRGREKMPNKADDKAIVFPVLARRKAGLKNALPAPAPLPDNIPLAL